MEPTLVEMRKLVFEPQPELSWVPLSSLKTMPQKTKLMVELKTPLLQHLSKELVAETSKIEILVALAPTPATKKMTERELETPKMMGSEPSL